MDKKGGRGKGTIFKRRAAEIYLQGGGGVAKSGGEGGGKQKRYWPRLFFFLGAKSDSGGLSEIERGRGGGGNCPQTMNAFFFS